LAKNDLCFYSANDTFGKLVQWRTRGKFTHVCTEIGEGMIIEAAWPRIRLTDDFGAPAAIYTPALPDSAKVAKALDWLYAQVGNPYSLLDIAANAVTFVLPNAPFLYTSILMDCSALTATFLLKAGYAFPADFKTDDRSLALVSPNDLGRCLGLL
jgi:uncharacterized protein YycO